MVKLQFGSVNDFADYCEWFLSQTRKDNPNGYSYEHYKTDVVGNGNVAYLYFKSSASGKVLSVAGRIPAKDVWFGFLPKAGHSELGEIEERLKKVNDHNYSVNPDKQSSSKDLGLKDN